MPTDALALALAEARLAAQAGEVPVGAVVLAPDGQVVGRGHNRVRRDRDPSAHAEVVALRRAAMRLGTARLDGCDLYVTLEPCPMCAAALALARIRRLYFGAYDPKGGGVEHGARLYDHTTCHHHPEVYGGLREGECGALLKDFFRALR